MTTQPAGPTKQELLQALRSSGEEVIAKVRGLPPAQLEEGRYENGWNARQILAHVASIEWTYPRLIDIARDAQAPQTSQPAASVRRTEPQEAAGVATRPVRGGILDYNERQVEKRAAASVSDLLDEFAHNRAATIAAVESAEDGLMQREIRSAGGITGPLAGVINAVAVQHVLAHAGDIAGEPLSPQRW
jgi:hypothetical protein